jgi:tRNA pseudouridine38-40 synthase
MSDEHAPAPIAGATHKYKLTIAYDGTDFHGWQRQPGVRTVQGVIEDVARRVLREPMSVVGASRTDAGVHAAGQVAHFALLRDVPAANVQRALSQRLPVDVTVVSAEEVGLEFHATRDARCKQYCYRIYADRARPVEQLAQRFAWHVWWPLDLERMRAAAELLVGRHDFVAFAGAGSPRLSTVRSVTRLDVRRVEREVRIEVEGDGFLYNQVRNMVGTLVEIGRGHWPPLRAGEILAARDRRLAGPTAPPHGLCLMWVRY